MGMGIGIFPLFGLATLICTIVAIVFRLDLRALQVANYLMFPLQILLILPLVRLGETMFGVKPFPLYPPQMISMLQHNMFGTLRGVVLVAEHALVAWVVAAPVSMALIYFSLTPYLLSLAKKQEPLPQKARAAAAR